MKILVVMLTLLLAGCTLKTPIVSEYRISIPVEKTTNVISSCKEKSLKVGRAFSSSSLMSNKMNYIENNNTEFTYTESEWSRSPAAAITSQLLSSVRATKLFQNVSNYKSRSRSDLVLETNIEEFIQYYRDNNTKSYVKIRLALSLVDTRRSKTISSTIISKELQTETLNAAGGVKALSKVLSEALKENNQWLSGVCK